MDGPEIFGAYTLLRRIATGGTAEIYLARRHGVEGFVRHLAIKRILPHCAQNEGFIRLLTDEAKLAAHLHHGHIIEIHEVGFEAEQAYIAMEYLPGTDLGRLLKAAKRRRRRILLCHDVREVRDPLIEALSTLPVDLCLAGSPKEALAVSKEGPIDLAIIRNSMCAPSHDPLILALQSEHPELLRTILLRSEPGLKRGIYNLMVPESRPEKVLAVVCACLRPIFPFELTLQVIRAVADALAYAHTARDFENKPLNIVHRDVGPNNVLVSVSGLVKLVDFGIAKAEISHRDREQGRLQGTFAYMSPEQCRGKDASAQSDLFSLGTLFYTLLAGANPFEGESHFATMAAIKEDDPAMLDQSVPGLPTALQNIMDRLLAKNPEDRFASSEEFLSTFETFLRQERVNLSPRRLAGFMSVVYSPDELKAFGVNDTGYDDEPQPLSPQKTPVLYAAPVLLPPQESHFELPPDASMSSTAPYRVMRHLHRDLPKPAEISPVILKEAEDFAPPSRVSSRSPLLWYVVLALVSATMAALLAKLALLIF